MAGRTKSCENFDESDFERLGVRTLAQCGFDHVELMVLRLLRHFCMTHAQPEGQFWRLAMQDACAHLGPDAGPCVALCVSDFLDALRSERMEPFNFVDPLCPRCAGRIFPAEWAMMVVLRGARQRNQAEVEAGLVRVVHMDTGATRLAARNLAELVEHLDLGTVSDAELRAVPTMH